MLDGKIDSLELPHVVQATRDGELARRGKRIRNVWHCNPGIR
jgi:hypothetical protein